MQRPRPCRCSQWCPSCRSCRSCQWSKSCPSCRFCQSSPSTSSTTHHIERGLVITLGSHFLLTRAANFEGTLMRWATSFLLNHLPSSLYNSSYLVCLGIFVT